MKLQWNKKLVCIVLAALGVLLMLGASASTGFRFDQLFADAEETVEVIKEAAIDGLTDVNILTDTEEVRVTASADDHVHLRYLDSESKTHEYTCNEGVLTLSAASKDRPWYSYIQFNFGGSERVIELQVPAAFEGRLILHAATGAIDVNGVRQLSQFEAITSTGAIRVSGVQSAATQLNATTGTVTAEGLVCGSLTTNSSTGYITLRDVTADDVLVRTTTGGVLLASVSAGQADASCATGSIKLDGLRAGSAKLIVSTGSVEGLMLGAAEDYTILSYTATGDNNLVNLPYRGEKTLEVQTTTGDINVRFEK